MSQLGDMGDLGDLGDGEDVQGLLENMMSQLLSKELLYEPLKELDEKVGMTGSVAHISSGL